MKKVICIVLLITLLFTLCACKEDTGIYDPDWIIGKTSLEIEERYGKFLQAEMPRSDDGIYRSTSCHYLLKEETDIFGYTDITLFSIDFNKNGVAIECFTQRGPIGG